MKNKTSRIFFLTAIMVMLSLYACKKEGPAEEAGRKLDEQAEHVKKAVQQSVEKVEDAFKKEKDSMQNAQPPQDKQKSVEPSQK